MKKIVIITGGSEGIGKALAIALIARGDQVVISSRQKSSLNLELEDPEQELIIKRN